MDPRCPRGLQEYPTSYCPLAVIRLKAIRNAGKELSEEEEALLPGCPWAINHQLANYCFFSYMKDFSNPGTSDIEIAALNCLSVDTIKKVEKTALSKVRISESMQELEKLHENDTIVDDSYVNESYKITH